MNSNQFCNIDDIDYRQLEVLKALLEEKDATYSFQGLRRKLGLHQEILSRLLDRLEDEDIIEKKDDGYRINSKNDFEYQSETLFMETRAITANLPFEVDREFILHALKGKWFGDFRWLGYSNTPSGLVLSWIMDNGSIQLRVKIKNDSIVITALFKSETDRQKAMNSAHELFDIISQVTRQIPSIRNYNTTS